MKRRRCCIVGKCTLISTHYCLVYLYLQVFLNLLIHAFSSHMHYHSMNHWTQLFTNFILLVFILLGASILDINCNVGTSAVAAIKKGLCWLGMEPEAKMALAAPFNIVSALSPYADEHDYFVDWYKGVQVKWCTTFTCSHFLLLQL